LHHLSVFVEKKTSNIVMVSLLRTPGEPDRAQVGSARELYVDLEDIRQHASSLVSDTLFW
jgi:hypothetical protein